MHKTLTRQITHVFGNIPAFSGEWERLLNAISIAYESFDKDRALIERSLEISSTELKEIVALLRTTLDSIDEGILVIDEKYKIINYNAHFLEMWKIQRSGFDIHDTDTCMTQILDAVVDPNALKKVILNNSPIQNLGTPTMLQFKNGNTAEMFSKEQIVDGVVTGSVLSFRDITNRLRVENELKMKMITLEKLNASMVNRELKMVELKEEIEALKSQQKILSHDDAR
jgi:PAS domain-containing protein